MCNADIHERGKCLIPGNAHLLNSHRAFGLDFHLPEHRSRILQADDCSGPILHGQGIAHQNLEALRLGLLCDFRESRLLRGCDLVVTYFLRGGSAFDISSACGQQKAWESRLKSTPSEQKMPRLRVDFSQIWPGRSFMLAIWSGTFVRSSRLSPSQIRMDEDWKLWTDMPCEH